MGATETTARTITRRRMMAGAAAMAAGAVPWHRAAAATDADVAAAFAATRVDRAVALLAGDAPPRTSTDLALDAPDLFEDGAAVPVTLRAAAPGVRRIALLIDRNPTPLAAVFSAGPLADADFGIRVKMAETSDLRLLGWAGLGLVETRRRVAVVDGGCGDEPIADELSASRQPGPMRIRAERRAVHAGQAGPDRPGAADTGAIVRVLMRHPMETGLRKDGAGRTVPAWHITAVQATLNGAPAFSAVWGNAVSANPYLQFTLPTARAGDRVALQWTDNRGGSRSDSALVA